MKQVENLTNICGVRDKSAMGIKAIISVARKLIYQISYTLKYNWCFTNTENTENKLKFFKFG
ncbi:MAG: hypothetical protein QG673_206 [Pseudomonadota bacterium]|nr:hypothetical protein [Pseudomonadota bacterium]